MNLTAMGRMIQRQVDVNGTTPVWERRTATVDTATPWKETGSTPTPQRGIRVMFVRGRNTDMYALLHTKEGTDVPAADLYAYVTGPANWSPQVTDTVQMAGETYEVQSSTPIAPNGVVMAYYVGFGA